MPVYDCEICGEPGDRIVTVCEEFEREDGTITLGDPLTDAVLCNECMAHVAPDGHVGDATLAEQAADWTNEG